MNELQLVFYDSKKNKKLPFKPADPNQVKIYSCGPTVYNYSHIGNIRSYLFVDILRRTLKLFGYTLDQTMNITDIDDKIIKESIQQKVSIEEFTKPWTDRFFADLKTLNVEKVEHYPKATESIKEMMEIIQRLDIQGLIYEKEGNIYFSIQKFKNYGSLSKIDTSGMITGARYDADEYEKDNIRDFVLWKAPKEEGEKYWDTIYGKGRPGWHLECSAMIRQIYSSGIDIHTGGIDLLFPHHENEIAQSEGAYPNEEFVRYWLHCEHLLVDGQKMSKSKGNFYVLQDILEAGHSWRSIRFLLLSFHYRTKLNFSFERLIEAKHSIERIQNTVLRVLEKIVELSPDSRVLDLAIKTTDDIIKSKPKSIGLAFYSEFIEGLADDLNTPKAIASIFDSIKIINTNLDKNSYSLDDLEDLVNYFHQVDVLLGLLDFSIPKDSDTTEEDKNILAKIDERNLAKQNKDFGRADAIRDELKDQGIILEDSKDGKVRWKRI